MHFDKPALMWVTDRRQSDAPLPELASAAASPDLDFIQIRESGLDRLPLELLVRAIATVSDPHTRIVVNSSLDLARKFGIGVHLPESGPSLSEARARLGPDAIIGRSVHSSESVRDSAGADYLIAGHVFETGSKQGRPPLGIDRFAEIAAVAPAPVFAIGGVTPHRVPSLLQAGAAGVAVMSPLTSLETIAERIAAYRAALEIPMTESTVHMVTATINGKPTQLPSGTTIAVLLAGRELHERLVVVERNGEILKRSSFPDTIIEEGDLLEIVHFVGGG